MRLDAFDYHLPESLIAQQPCDDRSASRLLVVDRPTGGRTHARFRDLVALMDPGNVLVVNRSHVVPARLFVRRASGGRVELLVAKILGEAEFIAIGSPLRKLTAGDTLFGEEGEFSCQIVERRGDREVHVRITSPHRVMQVLESWGHVPLPPYIKRPDQAADRARYQTVFAKEKGSVAAPTAGLHFDDALLRGLEDAGVELRSLALHVGLGTFMPLEDEVVERNVLHSEAYSISGKTLASIHRAKEAGHKVIAVGTTVTRVLETVGRETFYNRYDPSTDYRGETDLFIYPGFEFQVVDQLITNFHLPRSSLLLLVCAFLGREHTMACYREAIDKGYRFYSYGDAMYIR
jgi:S-adenosylmethionine:tRNA ribosyltransferase-isomerase